MSNSELVYDLTSPAFFADPHSTLHRMRAEAPVYFHPQMGTWFLTRYADVQRVTRDPRFTVEGERVGQNPAPEVAEENAAVRQFLSHWMVFIDGPSHARLRSLVARAFTPAALERLRPDVKRITERCIEAALPHGKMDIVKDLATPLPAEIIALMLGVAPTSIPKFKAWTVALMTYIGAFNMATPEIIRAAHRGVVGLSGMFRDLIAERRKTPMGDILSDLVAAEEQGSVLSEEELVSTCAIILVGGHETTTHLIGNATLALLKHPAELEKLRARPELFPAAIEELMRYEGAVFQLARNAVEDVEFDGQIIRKGQMAFGIALAANRDPAVFPDPDRLDIERKMERNVGFGYGVHFCLGAAVARMEATIALQTIITRLRGLALTGEPLQYLPSMAIRGLMSLPVTFEAQAVTRPMRHSEPPTAAPSL